MENIQFQPPEHQTHGCQPAGAKRATDVAQKAAEPGPRMLTRHSTTRKRVGGAIDWGHPGKRGDGVSVPYVVSCIKSVFWTILGFPRHLTIIFHVLPKENWWWGHVRCSVFNHEYTSQKGSLPQEGSIQMACEGFGSTLTLCGGRRALQSHSL